MVSKYVLLDDTSFRNFVTLKSKLCLSSRIKVYRESMDVRSNYFITRLVVQVSWHSRFNLYNVNVILESHIYCINININI
jgi:hypothetical protein